MSIATYSELKSSIADWMKRSDMTLVIPDFIALAEADMLHRLRLLEFETTASVTLTAGVATTPSGLLAIRSISLDGEKQLRYLTPQSFDQHAADTEAADAIYYTLTGSSIKVSPVDTGTLNITYASKFTPLSDSAPTNAVLTNWPHAYLFGALSYGDLHIRKDPTANKAVFESAMNVILEQNSYRKYPTGLVVRVA